MKTNIFFTLIIFFLFMGNVFSQKNSYTIEEEVEGIINSFNATDNNIRINYTLPGGDHPTVDFQVSFYVKVGDEELREFIEGLIGDYGLEVSPGSNKQIIWNFTEDLVAAEVEGLDANNVRITGKRTVTKTIEMPSIVVPAVVTGVGVGIIGFGVIQELNAQSDYDFYKENKILTDTYTAADRDKYFTDAEDKRGIATIAMAAGGVGIGVGLFLLRKKMQAKKAAKEEMKKHGLSFQPDFKYYDDRSSSVGMRLVYKF